MQVAVPVFLARSSGFCPYRLGRAFPEDAREALMYGCSNLAYCKRCWKLPRTTVVHSWWDHDGMAMDRRFYMANNTLKPSIIMSLPIYDALISYSRL